MERNSNIKSMKLYNHIDRIYNELKELGKTDSDPLHVDEFSNIEFFDQLHYHGTKAVDFCIKKLNIDSSMLILEIGSGIGGPARHIANETGATVIALELQPDQNKLASDLTGRCGLSEKVIHVCGDFLTHDWEGKKFDAIVSWLALYHIEDHNTLLQKSFDLLNPNGLFYAEDLISRHPFNKNELDELSREIFANYLPNNKTYKYELEKKGFDVSLYQDMSDNWTKVARDRIASYINKKDRHTRIHGKDVVNSLISFYSFTDRYFSSGKLGCIRVIAKKTIASSY